jgi:hypothetical protein
MMVRVTIEAGKPGLVSVIVMPSAEAALARLRADDRVWDSARIISAEETDEPQNAQGDLGISIA